MPYTVLVGKIDLHNLTVVVQRQTCAFIWWTITNLPSIMVIIIKDLCIGIYILERLLNMLLFLEEIVSMKHSFEEDLEKQRRV